MNVAVIGGSHGGYATAADLTLAGHTVRLWQRSEAAARSLRDAGGLTLTIDGKTQQARVDRVTTELAEAMDRAEVVIVALPATTHAEIAARLAPWLDARKIVLLTPGTLGSFVVAREIARPGGTLPFAIAETATLPYLARKTGPAVVSVAARAATLPTGVFPASRARPTLARLASLFPAVRARVDVLDAALTNPGPVMHPPLVLLNAGALDRGAFNIHDTGPTPTVRRLIGAVDAERVRARAGWGFPEPHYELAAFYEEMPAAEGFYGPGARRKLVETGLWDELLSLDHRYVVEDVALGLALIESAARTAGVDSQASTGVLGVFGALLGRRLSGGGRALEALGLGDLSLREIRAFFGEGWDSHLWPRLLR